MIYFFGNGSAIGKSAFRPREHENAAGAGRDSSCQRCRKRAGGKMLPGLIIGTPEASGGCAVQRRWDRQSERHSLLHVTVERICGSFGWPREMWSIKWMCASSIFEDASRRLRQSEANDSLKVPVADGRNTGDVSGT